MVGNEEPNDLYTSPNIFRMIKSRRMRLAGHVARMGERRGVYRNLVGKPEGKRPLGRHRRRCGITLRWIFRKWDGDTDWIDLAQGRICGGHFFYVVMNLRVP
jgi:hypothetical protein